MGKNEIKLRRQILSTEDIGRYRNYQSLLRRHERAKRVKRNVRIFTYSMLVTLVVILFLVVISYFMVQWRKKQDMKTNEPPKTSSITVEMQSLSPKFKN